MSADQLRGAKDNIKQTGDGPKIIWDDTGMRSTYANITEVRGSREEIKILFGVEQVRQTGRNEIRVRLTDQVVLRPLIAKKMAIVLSNIVRNYEERWGTIDSAPSASSASTVGKPSKHVFVSGTERSAEKGMALLQHVTGLDVEIAFEHSFKVVQRQLLDNRFLLGINRQDLKDKSDENITEICKAIVMPGKFFEAFKRYLPNANHIYFGFEDNEKAALYKVYLEFRDRIEEEIRGRDPGSASFLLYLGFKWDIEDTTRQAMTRYEWFPSLPVPDILSRLRKIIDPHRHENLLEIAESSVAQASERISHNDIQYLEVTEEGNPRKSFDINIYKAQLQLKDLYPLLLKTVKHHSIPFERFQSLYEIIKNNRFGHLAGGVDREDRDFLTVYYGVEYMNRHHLRSDSSVIGSGSP